MAKQTTPALMSIGNCDYAKTGDIVLMLTLDIENQHCRLTWTGETKTKDTGEHTVPFYQYLRNVI